MITRRVLFFLFWGFTYSNAQGPCTVERTQAPGNCMLLEQCPSVIEDYQRRRKHTRCGFDGRREIVCCPIIQQDANRNDAFSRIHEKKCHEYQSFVYDIAYSIHLSVDAEKSPIKINKCGHKVVPLIVGGEDAKGKEFPHMALVGYEIAPNSNQVSWACAGTLISERFVITAAHCLATRKYGDPKYVRLGELDVLSTTDDAKPVNHVVIEAIKHPEYSNTKYNDIALLKLDKNVEFNHYVRPACLPSTFESAGTTVIATGWGDTEYQGTSSTLLQKVTLDKFSQNECDAIYAGLPVRKLNSGIQQQSQLCAGSKEKSKDTCQGDSGGPIQVYHLDEYCMYIVIGVTSFGFQCGQIGVPGVYTRVFNYIDWIERNVWPNERL